jgi:hypothetical protein
VAKTLDRSESPKKKGSETLACCLPNCFFLSFFWVHGIRPHQRRSNLTRQEASLHHILRVQNRCLLDSFSARFFVFFSRFSEFSLAVSRPVMRDLDACRARRFTKISFSCAPGDGQGDNQARSCLQVLSFQKMFYRN